MMILLAQSKVRFTLLLLCITFIAALRLIPIVRFGDAAFGYDTGVYRRLIVEYVHHHDDPTQPPFAFTVGSTLLLSFGVPLDAITVGGYVAVHLFLCLAVFLLANRLFDRTTAVCAVLLLLFSVPQYEFYWWYYYRQALGLLCMLIAWLCLEKRSWWVVLPLVIGGSVHPFSFVPWYLTVVIVAWRKPDLRRFIVGSHAVAGSGILLLNFREFIPYLELLFAAKGVASGVAAERVNELTGQFLDLPAYAKASILYLPLALVGIWKYGRRQFMLSIFLATHILLYVCHVVLYRRFLLGIDLSLIFFAAAALAWLWREMKAVRFAGALVVTYMLLLGSYCFVTIWNRVPLVLPTEIIDIEGLRALPPSAPVIALTSNIAPWVYGFTTQPIVAPGMFEYNRWTQAEWNIFWTTNDPDVRHTLVSRYETSTLYIYVPQSHRGEGGVWEVGLQKDPHMSHIGEGIWVYSLDKTTNLTHE